LSEGEVFVPKKILKKQRKRAGKKEPSEVGVMLNDRAAGESPEEAAPTKMTARKQKEMKNMKKLCHKWLHGRCSRGKKCRYSHKIKEKVKAVQGKIDVKPRSFYAAVCLSMNTLTSSYYKVKWRGRISCSYKHYCISVIVGY